MVGSTSICICTSTDTDMVYVTIASVLGYRIAVTVKYVQTYSPKTVSSELWNSTQQFKIGSCSLGRAKPLHVQDASSIQTAFTKFLSAKSGKRQRHELLTWDTHEVLLVEKRLPADDALFCEDNLDRGYLEQ
jgi:hypothetical protein